MAGFNYENNKNNPRIYNNSQEFTLCSVFVKEFKIGLRPFLKHLSDGGLHKRLMKLFFSIKLLDRTSARGSLNVGDGLKTLKGKMLLREFVFTPKAGIRQQFGNPQINEDDFSLLWQDFDPSSTLFPKSATHFELQYLVLSYSQERNLFTTYTSLPIRRSKMDKREQLDLRPDKEIIKKKDGQYILFLCLRFFEILGEEEYELMGRNAVGIEVLDVR